MQNLHHAYLVVGGFREAEEFLNNFWEERGVKLAGSPDYFPYTESLFGIEEARKLSAQASKKAFTGQKVFLVTPEKITAEAQNALLKTFEDPYEDTHFFLVVREEELILPTLRSRMQMVRVGQDEKSDDASKFLKLGIRERLAYVKKFVDAEKNLSVFLDELLLVLRKEGKHDSVKKIYEVRHYSDDRSASSRLILEHLSLML